MSGPSDPHGPSSVASGSYPSVQVVQPPAPPVATTAVEAWLIGETVSLNAKMDTALNAIGWGADPVRGIEARGIVGTLNKMIEADKASATEETLLQREAAAREAGRKGALDTAAKLVGLLLGLITLLGIIGGAIVAAIARSASAGH